MAALYFAFGLGVLLLHLMFSIFQEWYGDDEEANLEAVSIAMWPFALGAAAVAVFFRVGGIIYERTTGVGEVLIAHN